MTPELKKKCIRIGRILWTFGVQSKKTPNVSTKKCYKNVPNPATMQQDQTESRPVFLHPDITIFLVFSNFSKNTIKDSQKCRFTARFFRFEVQQFSHLAKTTPRDVDLIVSCTWIVLRIFLNLSTQSASSALSATFVLNISIFKLKQLLSNFKLKLLRLSNSNSQIVFLCCLCAFCMFYIFKL